MKTVMLLLTILGAGFFLIGCTYTISQNVVSGHAKESMTDDDTYKTEVETNIKGSGSLFGL